MRAVSTLGMIAGSMAVLWVVASATDGNTTAGEAVLDPAGLSPATYRMSSVKAQTSCNVAKSRGHGGVAVLEPEPGCEQVLPGVTRAAVWRERSDGSVEFEARDGEALVAFSVADGVAYESFAPREALITLTEIE
ncbi:hypothetical protein [Arvimicrobium flavum]|uniref:hypothetical protein n=1 Tax=Arvimicrobium flavum TaxID=3393320 RepID=UPI00237B8576|nr:hypothetical protein [Mesorhizobium shangrilense]